MGRLKKIISVIVSIFTYILLFVLILVIYGKCSLMFTDKMYPSYFGYTMFEVASGSMEPTLYINDVILVNVTQNDLKEGDIIAFQGDDVVITHRILFIDGNTITVKGDKNNTIDKPIDRSQVIGKVVKILPKFGVWKKILTEPKILFALFITLVLFDFALSYNNREDKMLSDTLDAAFASTSEEFKKKKRIVRKKKVEAIPKEKKEKTIKESIKKESEVKKEVEVEEEKKITSKENKKDVIESEELLEITRKIDIEEINKLIEDEKIKLSKKEINDINSQLDNAGDKEVHAIILSKKENNFLEYTMRLDLNEIQKKIADKMK